MQFGNNGVGNDAVGDRTTLTSTVPVNPSGVPAGTLMVSDTDTGSAIVGETGHSAAIIGVNNGAGAGIVGRNTDRGIGVQGDGG
jgi:hypothetical protein